MYFQKQNTGEKKVTTKSVQYLQMTLTKTRRIYDYRPKSFFYVKLTKYIGSLYYVWLEKKFLAATPEG